MNDVPNEIENQENSEEINLSYFFNILANSKEVYKYLKSLKNFFNDYFLLSSAQYNRFNELYHRFFSKKIDFINNTPINKIEFIIKNIMEIQLKFLKSMVTNAEIINLLQNKLSELEKIIKKLPSKINHFSFNGITIDGANQISKTIWNYSSQLETKLIDKYINEKYNRHILGANNINDSVDNLVLQIKYLENSLFNILSERKIQYFDELKEYDNKTNNVFDEINNIFKTYISYIKNTIKIFNDNFLNLENDIQLVKTNKEENKENNGEKFIASKNDFDVKDNDINRFKYKIKILKNRKIDLQDNNENEELKNSKNKSIEDLNDKERKNNFLKEKFKLNYLILEDKDIYEIISKFYSYNFLVIDKSQYDLLEAKEQIEANDLSNKLFNYYFTEKNIEKNFKDNNYEEIIKLIDEKILNKIKNIEIFFLALNNHRGNGRNSFQAELFEVIMYIFTKSLDYLLDNPDYSLVDIMLILSQTYYKEINGEKIYIYERIKNHKLFVKIDFWEKLIVERLGGEFELKNKISYNNTLHNIYQDKNKDELIKTKLYPLINIMNDFNISKENILKLIQRIVKDYKCSDKTKEEIIIYFNTI